MKLWIQGLGFGVLDIQGLLGLYWVYIGIMERKWKLLCSGLGIEGLGFRD